MIEDEKKSDKRSRKVQKEGEDDKEILNPLNTSSGLNMVVDTINNKFDPECLNDAVRLLNTHTIRQPRDDCVPGHKYSVPGLPRSKILAHQVWTIRLTVRRWVWDSDMPEVPVADEMGLGKTFTSVAAAMICQLLTEEVAIGLPRLIL
jgi:hypothetical protein